ncbi:MAG: thioredoxin-disulfide reductase [Myxococcota bacterium]
MANDVEQVAIIGSGPAGWTAALYTARATLRPVVFTGIAPHLPGGQLMLTSDVENYPGFPEGILGPEIMQRFQRQAERFGARTRQRSITAVDLSRRPFRLVDGEGAEVLARTLIIATGASARLLGIAKEKELMAAGAGVSACATCDGAFYKDVDVAVVGGGDSAMEEALFLTRFAKTVTVVHRREQFRARRLMLERARQHPKIRWRDNQVVEELITQPHAHTGRDELAGVMLRNTQTGERTRLDCTGLFMAIGHQPNTLLFQGKLDLDEQGYIRTRPGTARTNIQGVFACGDVQDRVYRQAITAAGSGCMAAIDVERSLEQEGH